LSIHLLSFQVNGLERKGEKKCKLIGELDKKKGKQ